MTTSSPVPSFILTDIEGTTTSVRFVYDTLFPYAQAHLPAFLAQHANDPSIEKWITLVEAETGQVEVPAVTETLLGWIEQDKKHTALKALQGMVWETGYHNGTLMSQVYEDVPGALAAWQQAGITLGIYSSGSVQAQRLLFGHTPYGDLTPYFSHYFDTETGPKKEATSYTAIARLVNHPAESILFLSDHPDELQAAAEAGYAVIQLCRDGLAPDGRFTSAQTFGEVCGLAALK